MRTLRFFGLSEVTTEKQLLKRLQKVASVEKVEVVENGGADGSFWPKGVVAKVTASSIKEAGKVLKDFDRKTIHDKVSPSPLASRSRRTPTN